MCDFFLCFFLVVFVNEDFCSTCENRPPIVVEDAVPILIGKGGKGFQHQTDSPKTLTVV